MKYFWIMMTIILLSTTASAQTKPEIHGELNFKVGTTTIPNFFTVVSMSYAMS